MPKSPSETDPTPRALAKESTTDLATRSHSGLAGRDISNGTLIGHHDTIRVDVEVQLEIQRLAAADWVLLAAKGEIDLATVGKLESAIGAVLEEGTKRLVIDLNDVSFLDSTGLRTLLAAHTKLEELGGSLAVVVVGGPVQRLLDITGIGSTMNVYPSVEAATV